MAVNFGDSGETIREYFKKENFTFLPVLQPGQAISTAYSVSAYPTNYVIDRTGKIAGRMRGFDKKKLEGLLRSLLE